MWLIFFFEIPNGCPNHGIYEIPYRPWTDRFPYNNFCPVDRLFFKMVLLREKVSDILLSSKLLLSHTSSRGMFICTLYCQHAALAKSIYVLFEKGEGGLKVLLNLLN